MLNLPKKTLILIAVLVTIAVFLLAVAISMTGGNRAVTVTNNSTTPTPEVEKTATVAFSPASLDLTVPGASSVVDIMATSGKTPVTGVQAEITYDPTVISNVKLLPPDANNSLFGDSSSYINLFQDNKTPGSFIFAVAINLDGKPINGTGSVGKISFTVNKTKPSTQISFGPKTLVTAKTTQQSILNSTNPLTIKLQ